MRIIHPASPNQALYEGLYHLHGFGDESPSRNGSVVVSKQPVVTIWADPSNRVLVGPTRNANPFFHLVEAMWMLAGRNDLRIIVPFNARFEGYSDDGGVTQPGAYGYRWRKYFGYDQLTELAIEIRRNPDTRRAVLTMWDGGQRATIVGVDDSEGDLFAAMHGSADVPCNTHVYFDTLGGKLNASVVCRSNDILWGAYGANVVHFGFLLEYMAAWTGLPMGELRQFSNNFHIYTDVVAKADFRAYADAVMKEDVYTGGTDMAWKVNKSLPKVPLRKLPLLAEGETMEMLDGDIRGLMREIEAHIDGVTETVWRTEGAEYPLTAFFKGVVRPMLLVWQTWKLGDIRDAYDMCAAIKADDWREGCKAFLAKRMEDVS